MTHRFTMFFKFINGYKPNSKIWNRQKQGKDFMAKLANYPSRLLMLEEGYDAFKPYIENLIIIACVFRLRQQSYKLMN